MQAEPVEGYRNKDSIELACVWSSEKVVTLSAAACLSLPIMPSVTEALEVWVSAETERFLWHRSSKPWPLQASQYLQLCRCVLFRRKAQARLKPSTYLVRLWMLAFWKASVWLCVVFFFKFFKFFFSSLFICCISIFGQLVRNLSETQRPTNAVPFMSEPCVFWKKKKVCVAGDCKNNCVICALRQKYWSALFFRGLPEKLCTRFPYQSYLMQMFSINAITFWSVHFLTHTHCVLEFPVVNGYNPNPLQCSEQEFESMIGIILLLS